MRSDVSRVSAQQVRVRITGMNKFFKILVRTLVAILLIGVALILYLQFGDLSVHRDRILAAASDATGFEITSAGPFNLEIGREISLSAAEVVVTNPGWPGDRALASAGELQAVVDTWSLISGPIEIAVVQLGNVDINLLEDDDGKTNWSVPAKDPAIAVDEAAGPDPIVRRIVLDDVRVFQQAGGMPGTRITAQALNLDRSSKNRYDMNVEAIVDQGASTSALATSGSLQFGESLSNFTHARFEFDIAEIESKDAILASFSGFAAVNVAAEKPEVEVSIEVSSLEVKSGAGAQQDPVESDGAPFLFSRNPVTYSWLNSLNLDADIRIAKASFGEDSLRNIGVVATLNDGALNVSPVDLEIGEGKVSGSLDLLPADDLYTLNLTADVKNLRLARLSGDDQDPATLPPLNAQLNLSGQGASIHDIMASSSGSLSGRHDSGQLKLKAINALFSDFLTSILRTLNPLAEEKTYTKLECGIYEIEIVDGIADVREMVIQSERLTIVSSGNIDLDTEEIDLVMRTKTREGLGVSVGGVSNSFVKLGGTLKEPSLNVDAAGTVTTAGAAVATGGLSVLAKSLWDRLSGEVDLCSTD